MKIIFFGTPEFAVESLRRIHEEDNGIDVAAVVTAPDRPAGRGHTPRLSAVKQYALKAGLPIMQPEKLRDPEFISALREIDADLFVVIAFRMMPEMVWSMPRLGTFNLHGSLLPRYRGAAPINWAVINGEKETGVTTFFLSHDIDTGPIIAQERIAIGPDENVGSVYDRLMTLGADLTLQTLRDIEKGRAVTTEQIATGIEPTPAPKIFTETCRIDWSRSARDIHNLVRGLSPYPAAWSEMTMPDGAVVKVKVFATRLQKPGDRPEALTVTCGDGAPLAILELQPAGKKRMDASDFLRGLHGGTPSFI
ncbi:MAG: methionyl-tRNA formyltransferase [Pseudoflavonifractor sp.]|nr:methionyl-tRNA formyltransferase [Alloprevotella sp.]MCM1117256.1 methionyl-tRNA formyltransferase [Pseudoflavonifractor sp.]